MQSNLSVQWDQIYQFVKIKVISQIELNVKISLDQIDQWLW